MHRMAVVQRLLERITGRGGTGGIPVPHSRPAHGGRGGNCVVLLAPRSSDRQGTAQELDPFEKADSVGN